MELFRLSLVALGCLAPMAASAVQVRCAEDPRTNGRQCVPLSQVVERDGIRVAPLYQGGPAGVSKTDFTVHVNCSSQVLHLKDRQGVSFAGGTFSDSRMVRDLGFIVCDAPLAKPSRKASGPR